MIRLFALLICTATAIGCSSQPPLELRPATYEAPEAGAASHTPPGADRPLFLLPESVVAGRDIVSASATEDEMGRPAISIAFSEDAGDRLYEYTRQHINQPLAIVFDGEVISAPMIQNALRESAIITGDFTDAEVERIVSSIRGK